MSAGTSAVALLAGGGAQRKLPEACHDEVHGDPPYLTEIGWRPLLNGRYLTGWHAIHNSIRLWSSRLRVV